MPRFFAEIIDRTEAVIHGKDVAHIAGPLRRRVGDPLSIRDARQGFAARIEAISRHEIRLSILKIEDLEDRSPRRIQLGIALIAPKDMDEIMRLCTELGVHDIYPLVAERSNFRQVTQARRQRWEDIIREAVKQCERGTVPRLYPERDVISFLKEAPARWPKRLIALKDAPNGIGEFGGDDIGIIIGPEGGWTDAEVTLALEQAFVPVHLGRTMLRAVGAAVAAVAILGA